MFTGKIIYGRHGSRKFGLATYECDACHREFDHPLHAHNEIQARIKRKEQNHCYCSLKCRGRDRRGELHPSWRGGTTTVQGYVLKTVSLDCPGAIIAVRRDGRASTARMLEHRYVMQESIGRPLLKSESVHHKNGIKTDNRIENLELRICPHGIGATSYTEDVNRLLKENQLLRTENERLQNAWFVYMLRCRDKSLYCGITNDIPKRIIAHNSGHGSRYTRSHRPVFLVYFELAESKSVALKREYEIKQLSKRAKEQLIEQQ